MLEPAPNDEADEDLSGWSPTVVAEQVTRLRELTVADAVLELEITGAPVVVFRNAGHGRMSWSIAVRMACGMD